MGFSLHINKDEVYIHICTLKDKLAGFELEDTHLA